MPGLLTDVFNGDAFSLTELTDAFNIVPNNFGKLRRMNLFPDKPVRSPLATFERRTFSNNLLPSVQWGGPASQGSLGGRDLARIPIPHFPHEDIVHAQDVMGVRAFGSTDSFAAIQDLINEKLETMAGKHDITREFMSWGALNGVVMDGNGVVIADLFEAFGRTEKVIDFDLDNPATEPLLKVMEMKRYIELNMEGEQATGIWVPVAYDFFAKLITHPNVKAAYNTYLQGQQPLREDLRTGFNYMGVMFEVEEGYATTAGTPTTAPVTHRFIPDGTGRAVPLGTDSFGTLLAPADFIETVNTPGLPRYAKQFVDKFDRFVQLHTQSNPMPYCKRPQVLVKLLM
jgi:hypothetical protein